MYMNGTCTTGVMVNIGEDVSTIVPFCGGFTRPNSWFRLDLAGQRITGISPPSLFAFTLLIQIY